MFIREFKDQDTNDVVALWHECELTRAWNDPHKDIARKCAVGRELFLVGIDDDGKLMATAMGGYEGHRGWINYLAVNPQHQRRGCGRQLVEAVEKLLLARGCPKLNLQIREGNDAVMAFYESLGFANDNAVGYGKRLISDR